MTRLDPALVRRAVSGSSLEYKLTDTLAFGLATASPLQRAICRAVDGRPLGDLAEHPHVVDAIGDVGALPRERPREVYLLSGIRTGKSLLAACAAVHMALTCDVSSLRAGEIPRVSVVSLKKDLADVILNHLVGSVQASPLLRLFLVGSPSAEGIVLRHPSGMPVEVCVVAGSRAGSSLVARWSAGVIFDEAPRMIGADEGVVNFDDSRQAVLLRLLRGSQLFAIGSPWAPWGPIYETVSEHHGRPSAERLVIRAPAPRLNPVHWTAERVEASRRADPDAYRTDVLAEFATPEEAMFSSESLDKCLRKSPLTLPREAGCTYYAAMDPATRGNGWTLAIATRKKGKNVVVKAVEWIGSRNEPLDPGEVLREIAEVLAPYGVTTVHSDQVMGDALLRLARQQGLSLSQWTLSGTDRAKRMLAIRTMMDLGTLEVPDVPHLRTDMLQVRKRITPTGMQPHLPESRDGRHCDWAPTLMLVLTKALPEQVDEEQAGEDAETARMRELIRKRWSVRQEDW